jgi:WD40 repeat protein/tetratricopeptide (TPR) repeat protein
MDELTSKKPGLAAFIDTYNSIAKSAADSAAATDDKQLVAAGIRAALRVRPFPGLRSFEPDESDVFFGRKDHTDAILNLLREQQVIAVLGGSGSGKSSVVRAGVIPALTGTHKIEGRLGRWYVAVCKPGKWPIDELCDALWQQICVALVLNKPGGGAALAAALGVQGELRARLKRDALASESDKAELQQIFDREIRPAGELNIGAALWFASDVLDRLDREMNPQLRGGTPSLMLVIDQFEELFAPDVAIAQRDMLLDLLKQVFDGSKDGNSEGFYVIMTMRSEQLHHCAEFIGLSEIINGSMFLIDLIDEASLREAIWRPARRVFDKWGLLCKDEPTAPFDPAFVDWLVADSSKLRESLVHKPDQLPLMQHALRLTWHNAVRRWSENSDQTGPLTVSKEDLPAVESAADVGFMRACLNRAANEALHDAAKLYAAPSSDASGLAEAERLLRTFFITLARRDDRGNWARRLVERGELRRVLEDRPFNDTSHAPDFDIGKFEKALSVFVTRGYLIPRSQKADASDLSYEVSHEALIRHWRIYQVWLNEVDEFSRSLQQVSDNLLPEGAESAQERWEKVEAYGNSLSEWWSWIRAIRERKAQSIISGFNRANLMLAFGRGARFGARWVTNELIDFLKQRDRRRQAGPKSDPQYAEEARRLLVGVSEAYARLPERLTKPASLAQMPSHIFRVLKHPDNRLTASSVFLVYVALTSLILAFAYFEVEVQASKAKLDAQSAIFAAERDASTKITEKAQSDRERLVKARHHFAAQTSDRLIGENRTELAGLVALKAMEETAPDKPTGRLRQSLSVIAIAPPRGPLLFGTDSETGLIEVASNGQYVAGVPKSANAAELAINRIQLWDTSSGAALRSLTGSRSEISALALSPKGDLVAAGTIEGEVLLWKADSADLAAEFSNNGSKVTQLSFSSDGARLIAGSADGATYLWQIAKEPIARKFALDSRSAPCSLPDRPPRPSLEQNSPRLPVNQTEKRVTALALDSSNSRLIVSTGDGQTVLWDVDSGKCLRAEKEAPLEAISFGSSCNAAIAGRGRELFVRSPDDRFSNRELGFAGEGEVRSITFDPERRQFVIRSSDQVVVAREASGDRGSNQPATATTRQGPAEKCPNTESARSRRAEEIVNSLQTIRNVGHRILAADPSGRLLVVQPDDDTTHPLQIVRRNTDGFDLPGIAAGARVEAVSEDGSFVAVARDSRVHVWRSGHTHYQRDVGGDVSSLRFDAKGSLLAIGLDSGIVQIWAFQLPQRPVEPLRHRGRVHSVSFDRSGTQVVSASDDRTAVVSDLNRGRPILKRMLFHRGAVRAAAFAADDSIVTVADNGELTVFDQSGKPMVRLSGIAEPRAMVVDSTGTRVMILSAGNILQICDLTAKAIVGSIRLAELSAAGFGTSADEIVTVSANGRVAAWSVGGPSDAMTLKGYSDLSAIEGGWASLNLLGIAPTLIGGPRTIRFKPSVNVGNEDELRMVVEAALTRDMTAKELELYAGPNQQAPETRRKAEDPRQATARCALNVPDPLSNCQAAVLRDPVSAAAWFELGRTREDRASRYSNEPPDAAIIVAAAQGNGPALAKIGDWFSVRKPRNARLSGLFYGRAILMDPKGSEVFGSSLMQWGDMARETANVSRHIFEGRANIGDPAAHFLLGVLAERAGKQIGSADLAPALHHYAVAERLFEERGIENKMVSIRRAALTRILPPEVVTGEIRAAKSWGPPSTQPPPPAEAATSSWMPKLSDASFNDAGIAQIADLAIKSFYQTLGLNDGLDVLRADLLLRYAKATMPKDSTEARKHLESAKALYETEVGRDPNDTLSFDRLDETLALLSKDKPDVSCEGTLADRVAWFKLRPSDLTTTRQVQRLEAETNLSACLARIGRNDDARAQLRAASDHLPSTEDVRDSRDRIKINQLVDMIGDTYEKLGERESALLHYGRALGAPERSAGGRQPFSGQVEDYIDLQRRTVSLLDQGPISQQTLRAFDGYGDFMRRPVRIDDPNKKKELVKGSIGILSALFTAEPGVPDKGVLLAEAYRQLGEVQKQNNDLESATRSFTDARATLKTVAEKSALNPDTIWTFLRSYQDLADALREIGREDEAVADLRGLIDLTGSWVDRNPTDLTKRLLGSALRGVSHTLASMSKYSAAADVSLEWIRIRPDEADAWNALCWYRAILGQLQDALANCNRAIDLNPNDAAARDSRGFTYLKLGEFGKSIADYDIALNIRPTSEYSLYGRGLAKRGKGDVAAGEADIKAAEDRNPDIAEKFVGLGVQ